MHVERIDKIVAGLVVAAIVVFLGSRAGKPPASAPVNAGLVAATSLDYPSLIKDENFHILLGNAYAEAGLIDQALAEQREALRLNQRSASALNNVGFYSLQKGMHREAIIALEQAMQIDPAGERPRNNLRLAYEKAIEATPAGVQRDVLVVKRDALAGAAPKEPAQR